MCSENLHLNMSNMSVLFSGYLNPSNLLISFIVDTNLKETWLKKTSIVLLTMPLEYRREISDIRIFFKSKVGLVTTDLRKFLCTFKPRYRTRNYDPNNYYLTYVHNQDYYRHS